MRAFADAHPGPVAGGVLVACSGGADSLALVAGCLAEFGPAATHVATVDHGLQAGSDRRAVELADRLRERGVPVVHVLTVQVGTDGGLEAAARSARYEALVAAAGGRPVLLGHTADDQAETVLLGLARGSGPRSVAGMSAWRTPWGRPLLGIRRSDTENACREQGLEVWNDPHNSESRFTRVRLRREVLPLLEDVLGGGVGPALGRTAALMADDLAALDELAAAVPAVDVDGGLLLATLTDRPRAIRTRVLRRWAGAGGAGQLTADLLGRLDRLVTDGRTGQAVRLPGAVDAVRRRGRLVLEPVTRVDHTAVRMES
ncbi:tRNA lysidine(34) synthetase TilS [Nakamurella sp. YIM 132087]|uniref:tRNA(Ile)-lysidine synthase n=1 Tax=Nakamurella alba TaxID=2665158 RepID=A0A7K1FKE3_9ACTN|nr:tRNA lysidine(34) synthetase TilS [Nakamurella alba]